ncbi:MAG: nicotinate-nucleotide adenylyltransferase [Cellulosilyticum sp.]|nr:nicotinate-nucleotide adenylyltransferase [Cellulosilyticum sp.]
MNKSKKIKKLAIMGGTFDPIHMGHLVTAEEVRHEFQVDEVLFVPTGHPPHKSHINMTTCEHRYLMTVLATAANPCFKVSRIEIEREGVTYTIDTIKELKRIYGEEVQLYFITGADAVHKILGWKESTELLQLCDFVAVTRPGYNKNELMRKVKEMNEQYESNIHFLEVPALAISSSDIRRRLMEEKPIKYLVPQEVENYIKKHALYDYRIRLTDDERACMYDYVASKLSPKRYAHTRGVVEMALEYAKLNGIDYDETFIAALFHDIAKEIPAKEALAICEKYGIELDEYERSHIHLAHGKVGAVILQRDWGISKPSILDGIRYHTLGRLEMTDLEKAIYLADMTEEGRSSYKGKEEIKRIAQYNLNRAMYKALVSSRNYIMNILKQEAHPIINELIAYYKQFDIADQE